MKEILEGRLKTYSEQLEQLKPIKAKMEEQLGMVSSQLIQLQIRMAELNELLNQANTPGLGEESVPPDGGVDSEPTSQSATA
jgi:predicted nuclease with TOPRIM domain